MFRIIEKKKLADKVWYIKLTAPRIARKRKPGQYIILRINEDGERIPLTIANANQDEGSITLIVQEVGKTTALLGTMNEGDSVLDLAGPLGNPVAIEKIGRVAMVCGGIGTAPSFPIAEALHKEGNEVVTILGARTMDLIVMEEEMRAISSKTIIVTDDGSYGEKGFVTDALKKLLDSGEKIDMVFAIGPPVMMKAVSDLTRPYEVKTMVSLNTIMVDGTGMCGGCRVLVDNKNKFVCVDGPEFDGHAVDFTNMIARQKAYATQEKRAFERFKKQRKDHECRMFTGAK